MRKSNYSVQKIFPENIWMNEWMNKWKDESKLYIQHFRSKVLPRFGLNANFLQLFINFQREIQTMECLKMLEGC